MNREDRKLEQLLEAYADVDFPEEERVRHRVIAQYQTTRTRTNSRRYVRIFVAAVVSVSLLSISIFAKDIEALIEKLIVGKTTVEVVSELPGGNGENGEMFLFLDPRKTDTLWLPETDTGNLELPNVKKEKFGAVIAARRALGKEFLLPDFEYLPQGSFVDTVLLWHTEDGIYDEHARIGVACSTDKREQGTVFRLDAWYIGEAGTLDLQINPEQGEAEEVTFGGQKAIALYHELNGKLEYNLIWIRQGFLYEMTGINIEEGLKVAENLVYEGSDL